MCSVPGRFGPAIRCKSSPSDKPEGSGLSASVGAIVECSLYIENFKTAVSRFYMT